MICVMLNETPDDEGNNTCTITKSLTFMSSRQDVIDYHKKPIHQHVLEKFIHIFRMCLPLRMQYVTLLK